MNARSDLWAPEAIARTIRRHSHAASSRPIREAKTIAEAAARLQAVLAALEQQIARVPSGPPVVHGYPRLTDDEVIQEAVFERFSRSTKDPDAFYRDECAEVRRFAKLLSTEDEEN